MVVVVTITAATATYNVMRYGVFYGATDLVVSCLLSRSRSGISRTVRITSPTTTTKPTTDVAVIVVDNEIVVGETLHYTIQEKVTDYPPLPKW